MIKIPFHLSIFKDLPFALFIMIFVSELLLLFADMVIRVCIRPSAMHTKYPIQ